MYEYEVGDCSTTHHTRSAVCLTSFQLLGLFAVAAGSVVLVKNMDLDYVTGNDVFNGAAVIIAAGVAMIVVATLGLVAACAGVWGLVAFVSFCRL